MVSGSFIRRSANNPGILKSIKDRITRRLTMPLSKIDDKLTIAGDLEETVLCLHSFNYNK
jgi:hypothetical protein